MLVAFIIISRDNEMPDTGRIYISLVDICIVLPLELHFNFITQSWLRNSMWIFLVWKDVWTEHTLRHIVS